MKCCRSFVDLSMLHVPILVALKLEFSVGSFPPENPSSLYNTANLVCKASMQVSSPIFYRQSVFYATCVYPGSS